MRGASALQAVLEEYADRPVRALVVWEPVIPTDIAPPTSARLGQVHHPRTIQFWDEGRALSKDIIRAVLANRARYSTPDWVDRETIVWDMVLVFPRGAAWGADIPVPSYYGGPVVDEVAALRRALTEALSAAEE